MNSEKGHKIYVLDGINTFYYSITPLFFLKGFEIHKILTEGIEATPNENLEHLLTDNSLIAYISRIEMPRFLYGYDFKKLNQDFLQHFQEQNVDAVIAQYCSPHQSNFFRNLGLNELPKSLTFYHNFKNSNK